MDSQPEGQGVESRKKLTRLGLPIIILIALVTAIVVYSVVIKKSTRLTIPLLQKQPKVELKTEYKNPFKKESQFVNPFNSYKNPFVVK